MKGNDIDYKSIVEYYEHCLEMHGDTHLGVDWPVEEDMYKRYSIMLGIMKFVKLSDDEQKMSLLDFGCGTAHLLEFMSKMRVKNLEYSGLDLSKKFITVCREKFPNTSFYCEDILNPKSVLPSFDIAVMNGVFTEKRKLSFDQMFEYFKQVISQMFKMVNKGMAFNVMSKDVDWEREDLFHLPLDVLSGFLCKEISRNYIIRNDYGLYEYTVYILK